MLRRYEITVQRANSGRLYVARLETETHYAIGRADTPEEAVQNAALEASMIVHDDYMAHNETRTRGYAA